MENIGRSKVTGKGNFDIFFTLGKKKNLANVLHLPTMNINVASVVLLYKSAIKSVFELANFQNEYLVGKCYSIDGMVKLCTIDDDDKSLAYMVDSFTLCHGDVEHIALAL